MISIIRTTSLHPDFCQLVKLLDEELWARYNDVQAQYDKHNKVDNNATVVIAYEKDQPVGCACLKQFDSDTIEVKRMFVKPQHRGKGIAYAILHELERWSAALSFKKIILETGDKQPEAIGLYKKSGYTLIENYGPYIGMSTSVCLGKALPRPIRPS